VTDLVASERAISFGPFRLVPTQRLLLEDDNPVRVGSRALDILTALVERPGELVGKHELIARVWRRRVGARAPQVGLEFRREPHQLVRADAVHHPLLRPFRRHWRRGLRDSGPPFPATSEKALQNLSVLGCQE
jgi:hypothetical protein